MGWFFVVVVVVFEMQKKKFIKFSSVNNSSWVCYRKIYWRASRCEGWAGKTENPPLGVGLHAEAGQIRMEHETVTEHVLQLRYKSGPHPGQLWARPTHRRTDRKSTLRVGSHAEASQIRMEHKRVTEHVLRLRHKSGPHPGGYEQNPHADAERENQQWRLVSV